MSQKGSGRLLRLWRKTHPVAFRSRAVRIGVALAVLLMAGSTLQAGFSLPNLFPFLDFTGFSATNSKTGSVSLGGPFFQSLGTNGRTCGTCHAPSVGFGLNPIDAQFRYLITNGKDPLFAQGDPHGNQFTPKLFTIYTPWQNSSNSQQASIARGEQIFNTQREMKNSRETGREGKCTMKAREVVWILAGLPECGLLGCALT